jgi:TonB family protein
MRLKFRIALRIAFSVGAATAALAHAAFGQPAPTPTQTQTQTSAAAATGATLAPTAPSPSPSALVPPRLVTFVDATYPAEARAAGLEAEVELELTIDVTGHVSQARAVAPAGHGFDQAAEEAARRFVFEPARRGAQAIPARIRYRTTFDLAPAPASAEPPTGALLGRVLDRGTGRPVEGAAVTVSRAEGSSADARTAITDAAGTFELRELSPGRLAVKLSASDLTPFTAEEEIAPGSATSVTYRLESAASSTVGAGPAALEYGATATIEAPAREVTRRSLGGDELLRVAGTRGDPLKAIEYMPGVARSPQAELVIIRGSSPADSEVQFEGAPVYRLYHFGGLTSFVQPRLLAKIDLYPGNFSARFGRKMGGIIDVTVRDPRTDGLHGMVDINLVDSSFLFEGPLSPSWSFAVAAKRSYIDLFIDKLVPKDELQITAAPVYWDYQAMLVYKPSGRDRFRAMAYGSYDDLRLILAHPDDADPAIRGGLSSRSLFQRGQLTWQHQYGNAIEHEINLSVGPYSFNQSVGPGLTFQIPGTDSFLRAEWRDQVSERVRLMGGLDLAYTWFNGKYNGPAVTQLDGDPNPFGPLTGQQSVELDRRFDSFRPAAYAEAVWQSTDRLTLVPGGRVDYSSDVRRWTFDPRLTTRYQLTATTTLKGGVGLFSQAPQFPESLPVVGNPHLRPSHAQHYSLGVEQDVGARLKLTAEGFYKRLSLLTVNSPVPGQNLDNDGIGRIYGAEASARLRPTSRSSGFLSYTLSRSERNDHGTAWRLFNWDQTHILTVAGAYRLGRGWDLSGTFRYVTGNPFTPAIASVYNASTDTYKPVYGAINSARSNAFHRLDLRVEKSWAVASGTVALYLDVQNAYNRKNEESRGYNYDYTQSGVVSGLPILPTFGLRGEL